MVELPIKGAEAAGINALKTAGGQKKLLDWL
jgi:hypothetical protein